MLKNRIIWSILPSASWAIMRAAVCAAAALVGLCATPASATRGLAIDQFSQQATTCDLSAGQCDGTSRYSISPTPGIPYDTFYVYQQGIVSADAPLSGSTPADFAGQTYFTAGYSPNADYSAVFTLTNSYNPDGAYGLGVTFYDGNNAVSQVFFSPEGYTSQGFTAPTDVILQYPLGTSNPPAGAYIGYNIPVTIDPNNCFTDGNNETSCSICQTSGNVEVCTQVSPDFKGYSNGVYNKGLDFGASNFVVTVDPNQNFVSENFTPVFSATLPATPEPASWAMMVLGFGAVGWALRRLPRGVPALG